MIDPDKRKAVYFLHQEGMGIREISRQLNISVNTVKTIISQKATLPDTIRKDKIKVDPELLIELYNDCSGYVQRIYEKLTEEKGITIGYSTLTRLIRELPIGKPKNERCDQVPDEPGEMQHDTSSYEIMINGKRTRVIASLLYFRYSKCRYLKFYLSFNRFKMKCFLHEGLTFYGYSAPECIIDNTNLARLYGTGKDAVIVPEMALFAKSYSYKFVCHEKGHANRKAGEERGFYTVETNFFPGRKFGNMEDLNQQAFDWATVRKANTPIAKSGLIPAKAFEYERSFLTKLPAYITPPYKINDRGTDQYGYVSVDGNFYWVPGTKRLAVRALLYSDCLKVYHKRNLLGEYPRPSEDVKNTVVYPIGQSKPKYQPKYRKKPTAHEETRLRNAATEIDAYLNFALHSAGQKKHRFIRQLYALSQKLALPLFIQAIKRAHQYRIKDADTIERIAILIMKNGSYETRFYPIDPEFENRDAYLEGKFSDKADLSIYDKLLTDDKEDDDG